MANQSSTARIGLALIIMAVAGFAGWEWWAASRIWVPLDTPISLSPGHVRTREFAINVKSSYWVEIEVETNFDPRHVDCLLGSRLYEECTNSTPSVFKVSWSLSNDGRVVARGDSDGAQGTDGGIVTIGRGIGHFAAERSQHYVLDVDVLKDGTRLNAGRPRLRIVAEGGVHQDYGSTTGSVLAVALFLIALGAALLIRSAIARRDEKWEQLANGFPLSVPGPAARLSKRPAEVPVLSGMRTGGPYADWRQPAPSQRFPGLVSFGLLGGVTCAVLALGVYLMVLGLYPIPRGLYVRVLKPGTSLPSAAILGSEPLVVQVKYAGPDLPPQLYLNSKPVSRDELGSSLRRELNRRPNWVVFVDGDRDVAWRDVAAVVDIIRGLQAEAVLVTPETARPLAR